MAGVGGLEFCGHNVAAGLIESRVVEPVDVFHGGERNLLDGGPRFDQLGFEKANHGLGQALS